MIKVLQNWQEIEDATQFLNNQGLPTHITVQKNWDQWLLYQQINPQSQSNWRLDLGCGDCCTLNFLAALGLKNLHGIDLEIKSLSDSLPYTLHQGDMTATPFPNQVCDVAVSISVIEHGVDLAAFFREAHRLLQPDGLLFVTTDYWEEAIPIEASIKPFGLSWKIFSKADIEALIAIAHQSGFVLKENTTIPACADRTVSWYDKHYTFIALTFRKQTEFSEN